MQDSRSELVIASVAEDVFVVQLFVESAQESLVINALSFQKV